MYPEDRVLVAIMPSPRDFAIARDQGWYRIPVNHAPKGMYGEYIAFYFTRKFGPAKYAVHHYARILGHELYTRRQLLPDEPNHPRADELYYKVQIGPLQKREPPIVSRRWRRILFIHTTWDRFVDAQEINDLFVEGEPYVDRVYTALREVGIAAERQYVIREEELRYQVDLVVPCRRGLLPVAIGDSPAPPDALRLSSTRVDTDLAGCVAEIQAAARKRGGALPATSRVDDERAAVD